MTVGHQRAARGARRPHRADRDPRLRRPARDRPPEPPQPLPPLPGRPRAAGRAELRFEAAERIGPEGVVEALADERGRRGSPPRSRDSGAESVAVCLLFSFRDPAHERADRRARCARRCPSVHVSASHEVLPAFREYERCSTTVIDAYLSPLLGRYLGRARRRLPRARPARAAGDALLGRHGRRRPRRPAPGAWSVLSGPGRRRGRGRGCWPAPRARPTRSASTWAAPPATSASSRAARCAAPTRARSAGARSSCRWSTCTPSAPAAARSPGATPAARCGSGRARRGPSPGPACYGRGGTEPTVTDANLLLGYLAAGLGAGRRRRARRRGRRGGASRARGASSGWSEIEAAEGIVRVANQEMVRALRVVTVERGVDPRRFALLPFGGAGPMHAAALADELEIERILCPRASGVLSALGPDRRRPAPRHRPDRAAARRRDSPPSASRARSARSPTRATRGARGRRARGHLRAALPRAGLRAADPGGRPSPTRPSSPRPSPREHESRYGYRDPEARAGAGRRSGSPRPSPGPSRGPRAAERRRAQRGRRAGRASAASGSRPRVLRGEPAGRAPRRRGPACSSCPRRPWCCRPGWAADGRRRRHHRRRRHGGSER